ncbi:SAM-dependent methyltransferase [Frankia sp. R82]|uniref:SAM-dependent methyltransferase n=1 Tax=Frankia sp. R82 TaxID=2950553 RepID=UPI002042C030|nr:SAM-dependent methyltransferase [Frankia sp. R82]MCM3884729.1 nodulation S family protein [Frankia sp. R82]
MAAVTSLPGDYFDALYADRADPWGFRTRWYEQRKRALTMALLPERRYASGYEPGCSIGVLTRLLAGRCDRLLATDVVPAVAEQAAADLADLAHVRVQVGAVPADWPSTSFDLVVLSEVGYYLDDRDLAELAARATTGATTLLAVHWRHPVADYPLGAGEVHAALDRSATAAGMTTLATYQDHDLLAQVWSDEPRSVAVRTGIWTPPP